MYHYLINKHLISLNQAGSKQCDSCMNQLISINHEIYQFYSLDEWFEEPPTLIEKKIDLKFVECF